MISPRLDPDQVVVTRLITRSRELAQGLGRMSRAVRELQRMADHRADLLDRAAQKVLHRYEAEPEMRHPTDLIAAGLLVAALPDVREVD